MSKPSAMKRGATLGPATEVRYYDRAGFKGWAYDVRKIIVGKWDPRRQRHRAVLKMGPSGRIDQPGHGREYPSGIRGGGRFLHCWLEGVNDVKA